MNYQTDSELDTLELAFAAADQVTNTPRERPLIQVPAPVLKPQEKNSTVVVGQITDSRPNPQRLTVTSARPAVRAQHNSVDQDGGEARRYVISAFHNTMRHFASLPSPDSAQQTAALIRGASLTGYATRERDARRIDSVEGLRALIYASHRLTEVKQFDMGSRWLFFFSIPRGWTAYSGEAKIDAVVDFYHARDMRNKEAWAAWERHVALGSEDPSVVPPACPSGIPYAEVVDPLTGSSWGPWVQLVKNGTRVDFVQMPVIGRGGNVHMEWKQVCINMNVPMHRAETLTFAVDRRTDRLITWQPGRYATEMTPAQRTDRIILASGDVCDDEI